MIITMARVASAFAVRRIAPAVVIVVAIRDKGAVANDGLRALAAVLKEVFAACQQILS